MSEGQTRSALVILSNYFEVLVSASQFPTTLSRTAKISGSDRSPDNGMDTQGPASKCLLALALQTGLQYCLPTHYF